MLSMLETTLLPKVRELVGPRRRITIAFDREGWSPRLFAKWKDEKFDVLTYRKGEQTTWQKRFFSRVKGKVGGRNVEYCLAERQVKLSNGLLVREIRRLSEDAPLRAAVRGTAGLRQRLIAVGVENGAPAMTEYRYNNHFIRAAQEGAPFRWRIVRRYVFQNCERDTLYRADSLREARAIIDDGPPDPLAHLLQALIEAAQPYEVCERQAGADS